MQNNSILITGEQGFVGSLMKKSLHENAMLHVFDGDVTDREYCWKRLAETRPNVIVHLAALSLPKQCDDNPALAKQVNVEGVRNIADAAQSLNTPVHLVFISTAQIYDHEELAKGNPIDESAPVRPQNLYAETKRMAEVLLDDPKYSHLSMTILRLFNHVHKSQNSGTFMSSIYTQIQDLKNQGKTAGVISTGNLDLWRELNPVQSLIELLCEICVTAPKYKYEIFNVCSGKSRSLKLVADAFAQYFNLDLKFNTDPALIRKNDAKIVVGSNQKIKQLLNLNYADLNDLELVKFFCSDI